MGKSIYFDPDEFAILADYYNDFGDISEAEHIVKSGLEIHPMSSQLMIVNAKLLAGNMQYQEAYDYLLGIAEDENNIDYLLVKIECLLNLDQLEQANEVLDSVLQGTEVTDEDLYTFLTEVGYLYNDVELYDVAILLLEKACEVDNEDLDVLIDLSFAYEMLDNFEKAIGINNSILDINPYSFDGWVNLGKLHSMTQDYEKSLEAFDFALTIDDSDVNVLKMKALTLYLNDNVEEAVRIFRECLDNSPDDDSLYDSLLEGYEVMEQYDVMLELIAEKESKFGPEGILMKRAHIYLSQDKYEEAQEVFEKVPNNEKDTLEYYILEGELAIYNEDFATAEKAYMLAIIASPDDEMIVDKLANISMDLDKYEKAAEYLEQLMLLNPDFPSAKARLAFLRFEIGAKEPFDEIMSQFSDHELRALLTLLSSQDIDYDNYDREKMLIRLNEARENRVLFKNIKY